MRAYLVRRVSLREISRQGFGRALSRTAQSAPRRKPCAATPRFDCLAVLGYCNETIDARERIWTMPGKHTIVLLEIP